MSIFFNFLSGYPALWCRITKLPAPKAEEFNVKKISGKINLCAIEKKVFFFTWDTLDRISNINFSFAYGVLFLDFCHLSMEDDSVNMLI